MKYISSWNIKNSRCYSYEKTDILSCVNSRIYVLSIFKCKAKEHLCYGTPVAFLAFARCLQYMIDIMWQLIGFIYLPIFVLFCNVWLGCWVCNAKLFVGLSWWITIVQKCFLKGEILLSVVFHISRDQEWLGL